MYCRKCGKKNDDKKTYTFQDNEDVYGFISEDNEEISLEQEEINFAEIPEQEKADEFLPHFETDNCFSFETPRNLAFSAGPDTNTYFKFKEHRALLNVREVVKEAEEHFEKIFGRHYTGLIENYKTVDADFVIITLGTISGLVEQIVNELRENGIKAGLLRIRYMRPFPDTEIVEALKNVKSAAVLEKDISFGSEGTVFTNVNSALKKAGSKIPVVNYIAGLGGKDISADEIRGIFSELEKICEAEKLEGDFKGESSAFPLGEGGVVKTACGLNPGGRLSPSYIHFLGLSQEAHNA